MLKTNSMNFNNYTIKSQEAIQRAQQIAVGNETQTVELGHVLKGAFEVDSNVIPFIFSKLGVNYKVGNLAYVKARSLGASREGTTW